MQINNDDDEDETPVARKKPRAQINTGDDEDNGADHDEKHPAENLDPADLCVTDWRPDVLGTAWLLEEDLYQVPLCKGGPSTGKAVRSCNAKSFFGATCGLPLCRSRHVVDETRFLLIEDLKTGRKGFACEHNIARHPTIQDNPFFGEDEDQAAVTPKRNSKKATRLEVPDDDRSTKLRKLEQILSEAQAQLRELIESEK